MNLKEIAFVELALEAAEWGNQLTYGQLNDLRAIQSSRTRREILDHAARWRENTSYARSRASHARIYSVGGIYESRSPPWLDTDRVGAEIAWARFRIPFTRRYIAVTVAASRPVEMQNPSAFSPIAPPHINVVSPPQTVPPPRPPRSTHISTALPP